MDIVLLIEKYLSGREQDRVYDYDSYSHNESEITKWDFANIPQPTMEELEALAPSVQVEQDQAVVNKQALDYLVSTDWMVLRHIRQKALGQTPSLTDEQYLALEQERADKAVLIVT